MLIAVLNQVEGDERHMVWLTLLGGCPKWVPNSFPLGYLPVNGNYPYNISQKLWNFDTRFSLNASKVFTFLQKDWRTCFNFHYFVIYFLYYLWPRFYLYLHFYFMPHKLDFSVIHTASSDLFTSLDVLHLLFFLNYR